MSPGSWPARSRSRRHRFDIKHCSLEVESLAPSVVRSGGAGRDRTGDLRLAKAALSQLSYSPEGGGPKWIRTTDLTVISRAL